MTTGPSATPARSSIAYAVSISSLTGVSSGTRHKDHLAAGAVGEQLDDVGGLPPDRSDPHRIEQPARRQEELDRVSGRGGVDQDEVGSSRRVRGS